MTKTLYAFSLPTARAPWMRHIHGDVSGNVFTPMSNQPFRMACLSRMEHKSVADIIGVMEYEANDSRIIGLPWYRRELCKKFIPRPATTTWRFSTRDTNQHR
jgi:hypothetical protein